MSVTFAAQAIFNSGPHRAVILPVGSLLQPLLATGTNLSGFDAIGALALTIEVRGRLVGTEGASLADQLAAIEAFITDPPSKSTLVLHDGRSLGDMSFTRFERLGPPDVGRVESQAFVATFVHLPR